jgi:hypothetical protein
MQCVTMASIVPCSNGIPYNVTISPYMASDPSASIHDLEHNSFRLPVFNTCYVSFSLLKGLNSKVL